MLRTFVIQIFGAILSIGPIIKICFMILKHGWKNVFYVKPRAQPPPCLQDPKLGEHKYIRTQNGIRLHFVQKGDPANPLMLFLHGFPEFWYSWRYQMDYFSSRGYFCVSMDLRGYNDSDKPKGIRAYGLDHLTNDVKEVIESLGKLFQMQSHLFTSIQLFIYFFVYI